MTRKVVVTAAVAGGGTFKEQNPNVPYEPEEFVREAIRVEEAGAAVIHIHFRDPKTGWQTFDPTIMAETMQGIEENTHLLINLSTGGMKPGMTLEDRKMAIVHHSPHMASLNPGTMNFCFVDHRSGRILMDETYYNPYHATIEFGTLMQEKAIKPELECFALSHVHNVLFFTEHYGFLTPPLHFSIVFGVAGGVRFNSDILNSFIHAIPPGSTWQGIGIGPFCFPVVAASATFGGHVRVGLEDNIYVDQATRTLAKGSWDQVEKAIKILRLIGHEPATPAEAAEILSLPKRIA